MHTLPYLTLPYLQSSYRGVDTQPETYFGFTESGWITTTVFYSWLQKFATRIKDIRPLLLMFDGHSSHLSLETIEFAMEEGISVIKLQPHCTDLLQPLDVSCFSL